MYEEEVKQLREILNKLQSDDVLDCHITGTLEEVIYDIDAYEEEFDGDI